jgi:parallel beta-helix repeat protein
MLVTTDRELLQAISAAKAGDVIALAGSFGALTIEGGAHNKIRVGAEFAPGMAPELSGPVRVISATDDRANVASVLVRQSDYWRFECLDVRPGPQLDSFIAVDVDGYRVEVVDCSVSYGDPTGWTPEQWLASAGNGVMVRGPLGLVQGCRIETVATGIQFFDMANGGRAIANTVTGIAKDGGRAVIDDVAFVGNHFSHFVKVSANHDDALQFWPQDEVGTGTIRDIVVRDNTLDCRKVPGDPLSTTPHGISFFKGKGVNCRVENNTVHMGHWNGIVFDAAEGCHIIGNTVTNETNPEAVPAQIRIKVGDASNVVANNEVDRLFLPPEVTRANNVERFPLSA